MPLRLLNLFRSWRNRQMGLAEYLTLAKVEQRYISADENNPLKRALASVQVGDLEAGKSHWLQACEKYPSLVASSHDSLEVLLALGLFDDAELLMTAGQRRSSADRYYYAGFAKVAHRRGALAEAVHRWAEYRKKFPSDAAGYFEGVGCMRSAALWDEGEALIARARAKFPAQIECAIEWARLAEQRADWEAALHRWKFIHDHFGHLVGTLGQARALGRLGRFPDATKFLQEALRPNPYNLELRDALAEIDRLRASN